MNVVLVVPDGLGGPSGGSIYNERLATALTAAGHRVRLHPVSGAWPHGTPADHRQLVAALQPDSIRPGSVVLVDGIIASAAPEAIKTAVDAGTTVWVLLHLPLPAETGLSEQEMRAFAVLEGRALRHATGVICTSSWARDDLLSRYRLNRVYAVPPGTGPAPVATGSYPPHLLMLGSLTPRKNHSMALTALADVADLSWTASVVGGPLGSDHASLLTTAAAQHFAPDRITFHGVLQGAALDAEWSRTDLVLLPSVAETFGMVITEGLARGIPGVVGAGTGAVEALTGASAQGTSGLPTDEVPGGVVDPRNPDQLAALLRGWLTDPSVSGSWRSAALRRRDTLPRWANTASTLQKIIEP